MTIETSRRQPVGIHLNQKGEQKKVVEYPKSDIETGYGDGYNHRNHF